ncbi:glycosyltransferase family 4 protein [Fimbriiglobus ruber]|uniref:Glycosyltransferase n=1 Tax=Fimbriiglobus ruber TaxID=1908690 RepID=A0A225DV88_9BACT|nr:glycosyltransferase family 4 protein [Fimbriiglobus ruber]OWK45271.1 Glycosyltransferase [Fimbriiglobus ruber]
MATFPNPLAVTRRLAGRARAWWHGPTGGADFDATDPRQVASFLAAHGVAAVAGPADPHAVNVARRVWELRQDLRQAFPLGLTPAQRRAYAGWLLTYAAREFGLAPASVPAAVIAYFRELAADPSRGLAQSYLWHPEWQAAVPHGLTRFGWDALRRWVAVEYNVGGRWLKAARCPDRFAPWDEVELLWQARPDLRAADLAAAARVGNPDPLLRWLRRQTAVPRPDSRWLDRLAGAIAAGIPAAPAVNMLAHFRVPCGLQEEAVQLIGSLTGAGFRVARRDLTVHYPCDCDDPADYADPELFPITITKTGAGRGLDGLYPPAGLTPRPGVYRIAAWSWELEQFPAEYAAKAALANEVWTPSEFCATAVRKVVTDRPVLAMMPGLATPPAAPAAREAFGLQPGRFLFLFLFDMGSAPERKNFPGLIRAFRKAFRPDEPVDLVLKVSRGEAIPAEYDALRRAAAAAGVTVVNRVMTRAESFALMAACDCYVSLHRAEGFGLTVAEAMLLGKPVVATNYSATTEFLTAGTGLPVDYRLVPVGSNHPPYAADAVWAEPDEDHAAAHMRWVVDHPVEARALGAAAKRHAEVVLSPEAAGRRMADRLRTILADRAGAAS